MWRGNPVLTAVLFGLPLGFLSLICYSICCADIMDADDEDEEGNHIVVVLQTCQSFHTLIQQMTFDLLNKNIFIWIYI
jgi:hypothetical protein